MQKQHLKLKEIIWEITGECKNGCTYCGSKSIRNQKNNEPLIAAIAEAILKYPPEEINISGGDPLLVGHSVHQTIISSFKEKSIICKLIINPISLNSTSHPTIALYDWVGISINTKKDLEKFIEYKKENNFKNFTVITNFNLQNLYDFNLIESFVKEQDCLWTIQFTIYESQNNPLALYNPENEEAFKSLKEKYMASSAKIILSDNIRADIGCGAGLSSLGILYDGQVVPCLSMRSWESPEVKLGGASIINLSLKEIWENGFKKQRFGCFECCKDSCNNKTLLQKEEQFLISNPKQNEAKIDWDKLTKGLDKLKFPPHFDPPPSFPPHQVIMYGVTPNVMIYGVRGYFDPTIEH